MKELTTEYLEYLENLNKVDLIQFLNKIKSFKTEDNYFREIEQYLNENINEDILNIWNKEEFIKIFYLEPQAKYIIKILNLDYELGIMKTLVYCYNTNQRKFQEKLDLDKLEKDLFERGFKKQELIKNKEYLEEELKKLDGLKVCCVMDISKIGLLGSFDKKEEIKGTLTYSDYQKGLMLIPARCRTRGFLIRKNFYYKRIL